MSLRDDLQALAEQRRFVCYKMLPNGKGGFSKPPIDPSTGYKTDIRGSDEHLYTLEQALEFVDRGAADGAGITTGERGGIPLCGIDIDHCIQDGEVLPEFKDTVSKVASIGYCEFSPSGTGIHGLALCRRPAGDYMKRRGGIEVYDDGQYLTLTGNRANWMSQSLSENDAAVRWLCERYLKKAPPAEPAALSDSFDRSGRLDTALQHDPKFAPLWNGERPNGNESSDDLALMNKLAYWLDRDESAMIDAFRASPHAAGKDAEHEKKLERSDYLLRTAHAAAEGVSSTAGEHERQYAQTHDRSDNSDIGEKYGIVIKEPTEGQGAPVKKSVLTVHRFSDVHYERPKWFVEPYIPMATLTIIQGDPGAGKTAFACKLAALASTGGELINGITCRRSTVLLLSTEDDPSILRGRIDASGGDPRQCLFLDNAHELTFNDARIEALLRENDVNLLIFDPFKSFLGAKVDMHRANETRPVLNSLAAMAKRCNCAVVVIAHMSKGGAGGKSIYRALGSVDIPGMARSVLHIGRNPENDDECILAHVKSSTAKKGQSICYHIVEHGGVVIDGWSNLTAEDLETIRRREGSGVSYDDEPIVIGARKYIAEHQNGGKITYDRFSTFCLVATNGIPPYINNRDAPTRINALRSELMQRDHILVDTGVRVKNRETCEDGKGISIMPYQPTKDFQTRFELDSTEEDCNDELGKLQFKP